jgi:glycogen synthase
MSKRTSQSPTFLPNAYLLEAAWEVCNQVGGIYTVIRSKAPVMMQQWAGRYCMIGPYVNESIDAELEHFEDAQDIFGQAAASLRSRGFEVHYAEWLVTGKPRVILLNPKKIEERTINVIKYLLWKDHGVGTPADDPMINQIVGFAYLAKMYVDELMKLAGGEKQVIAHFHEWMAGLPILDIKKQQMNVKTIFTTHATQLGRHLAINSPQFYQHLPFFKWEDEAKRFGVETEATMEYKIAQACDVFTTVSDLTGRECKYLLKRDPDGILPNGLNIHRFETLYEFQNLHSQYKEQIHEFVMGHFFHSYSFNLDKTMYFFTSGRFEFKNKGFDLTLEALSILNEQLKRENSDITIVMFIVSKRDFYSIQPAALHSHAVMEEIRQTCDNILKQVGKKLFNESMKRDDHRIPDLNEFVDEYWKLRYRRTIQSWKAKRTPMVVTHDLVNEESDEVIGYLRKKNLLNQKDEKVKVVYHPDFISSTNPLFGMDYLHFVRGCNMGVFPSYYEPWGYTPLESIAAGIPAVTSDLAGFGDYLLTNFPDHEKNGLFVVERKERTFDWSARQLAAYMYKFLKMKRSDRIIQRNNAENYSVAFGWHNLISYYNAMYERAVEK